MLNLPYKLIMVVTGGGSGILPRLTENGGASAFFDWAAVPYSKDSFESLIGEKFDRSVSATTVNVAAEKILATNPEKVVLVSSAKLIALNERPGREHVSYITIHSPDKVLNFVFLPKTLTRKEQEDELVEYLLEALKEFSNEKSDQDSTVSDQD